MLRIFKNWCREDKAVIAIEMGMILPLMVTVLVGIMDTGMGVLTSQKAINASQMIRDLLGRQSSVSPAVIDDTFEAGKLAMAPYSTASFGIDVMGVQFVGGPDKPKEIWRQQKNMNPNQNMQAANAANLGNDQEGVLGVTAKFTYTPIFTSIITGPIDLIEVSYVRGRTGLFIPFVG